MVEDGQATAISQRPMPPEYLIGDDADVSVTFAPAHELVRWLFSTFIEDGAPLQNEDHQHLVPAQIGALWTTVTNARAGRRIIGMAEYGPQIGGMGRWQRARAEHQITQWFGAVPDFLLTFDADYASSCSDAQFCALVEHELYHCGQERDAWGQPKFRRQTGLPAYAMRGHDVEEFVGVVRRYGASAAGVTELVEAAAGGPIIAAADISAVCGTCGR